MVDRLTSVGRQLLLPVFFIVAGLRLDLTGIGAAELGELAAIVAVGGTAGLRAPKADAVLAAGFDITADSAR